MTDSSAPKHRHRRPGRRRLAPAAVVAGVVASAAIATSMTGTLGAFVASIQNTTNNTASGYLTMSEQNSGQTVTCTSTDATGANAVATGGAINTNSATCAGINKYGGSSTMVPGQTVTTTVTITNTGSVAASAFSLTPTACQQVQNPTVTAAQSGSATDFCSRLSLVLTEKIGSNAATTQVNGTTLTGLGTTPIALVALTAGQSATFSFAVTFNSTGTNTTDNTYQGLQAKQMLTWTFTS